MSLLRPAALLASLILVATALDGADVAPTKPKPDAQFGNVLYRTPEPGGWTMEDQRDRRVFSARVAAPDFCTLTVFAGGKLEGDFGPAFDRAITASLRELRSETIDRDGGMQPAKAAEGFEVLQRTLVAHGAATRTFHWFLAGNSGGRFDMIAFQASNEDLFQRYGQVAADFFFSVKLANSLAPANAQLAADAPARAATAMASAFGPLKVGDHVEIPWGGGWIPGVVLNVEGLTYFVHYGSESDAGKYDDFFTLNLLRPPGGAQTYAETFHETAPDPDGGPLALGEEIEYYDLRWVRGRVARHLADRYVVFADKPGYVTEIWATMDKIRRPGSTAPLGQERPLVQRRPTAAGDIRIGDLVEARPRTGSWVPLTVLSRNGSSYFVKIGPNSGLSMRGWVDRSHMRPVGSKDPFEAEDLTFFVGRWRLTGDSFQNLVDRKVSGGKVTETYQNNSGAGQNAGFVVINADGTYQLGNTVVYHDGRGRWERNPNQDEGGILLRGADGKGDQDCLVTNHQDGFGYLQGAIRGPGKWCTKVTP